MHRGAVVAEPLSMGGDAALFRLLRLELSPLLGNARLLGGAALRVLALPFGTLRLETALLLGTAPVLSFALLALPLLGRGAVCGFLGEPRSLCGPCRLFALDTLQGFDVSRTKRHEGGLAQRRSLLGEFLVIGRRRLLQLLDDRHKPIRWQRRGVDLRQRRELRETGLMGLDAGALGLIAGLFLGGFLRL